MDQQNDLLEPSASKIVEMSVLLEDFATILVSMSPAKSASSWDLGLETLKAAVKLARRKTDLVRWSGPRLLHEHERSLLVELQRAILLTEPVLNLPNPNLQLQSYVKDAQRLLHEAAFRDSKLFEPFWMDGLNEKSLSIEARKDWVKTKDDISFKIKPNGVPLWVHRSPNGHGWIGRVGLSGVVICRTDEEACVESETAYLRLFPLEAPIIPKDPISVACGI